jgi:hypothetical protein
MRVDESCKRGQFYTPSPRVISKLFWVERPKGLGQFGWEMAQFMKLWNIRYNPELKDILKLLKESDRNKLGRIYFDDKGKQHKVNSPGHFINLLTQETIAEGFSSNKDRFWDGNPNVEFIFKGSNDVSSEFIREIWKLTD